MQKAVKLQGRIHLPKTADQDRLITSIIYKEIIYL